MSLEGDVEADQGLQPTAPALHGPVISIASSLPFTPINLVFKVGSGLCIPHPFQLTTLLTHTIAVLPVACPLPPSKQPAALASA